MRWAGKSLYVSRFVHKWTSVPEGTGCTRRYGNVPGGTEMHPKARKCTRRYGNAPEGAECTRRYGKYCSILSPSSAVDRPSGHPELHVPQSCNYTDLKEASENQIWLIGREFHIHTKSHCAASVLWKGWKNGLSHTSITLFAQTLRQCHPLVL